jgi:RNA polymerase sigma-70 factor, ECF subfamily
MGSIAALGTTVERPTGRLDTRARRYLRLVEDLSDLSDAALVLAVARERQDALAEVYRRHGGPVFALARRVLAQDALAEEVLQEVFLHLWRLPDRFDPDRGTLRTYLLALGHARSVDAIRSEVARRRREERDAVRADREDAGIEDGVVASMAAANEVSGALATLSDDERRAIELAYYGGHTYREVAAMLGQAEGTVKSRIRSGLRRMRGALTEIGMEGS